MYLRKEETGDFSIFHFKKVIYFRSSLTSGISENSDIRKKGKAIEMHNINSCREASSSLHFIAQSNQSFLYRMTQSLTAQTHTQFSMDVIR